MMTREKAIRHIKNAINVPNDLGLTVIDIESLYEALTWTEPVRRGRWIAIKEKAPWLVCSECGTYLYNEQKSVAKYCYNCGARMEASE